MKTQFPKMLTNLFYPSTRSADAAEALLIDNAAITATETYELNQQEYNQVFLDMIVNGQTEPDSTQRETLLAIAVQCPYEGGDAVYQARALLGDGAVYDDSTACDTSGQQFLMRPTNPSETIEFSITPNPGNGYTFVELQKEAEEEGDLMLINALGKLIHKQYFLPGDKTFVLLLDEIPSGSYYVAVKTKTHSSTKIFFNLK
jgi:hypothetical protein